VQTCALPISIAEKNPSGIYLADSSYLVRTTKEDTMPFDGPLTEEQRRFAEQNHALVYKFLHQHGLSVDEYYDIVVFGFLLAVQRYLPDASLAPYAFSTVAWSAMESALRNHRRTARRKLRLHTGSGRHGRYRLCRREFFSENGWVSQLATTLMRQLLAAVGLTA